MMSQKGSRGRGRGRGVNRGAKSNSFSRHTRETAIGGRSLLKKMADQSEKTNNPRPRPPNRPNPFRKVPVDIGSLDSHLGTSIAFVEVSSEKEKWHTQKHVREMLAEYHKTFGGKRSKEQQIEGMKKEAVYQDLYQIIDQQLKEQKECKRFEFTGSWYEETKVDDGLEFDIMIIIDGSGFQAEPIDDHIGFAHLKPKLSLKDSGTTKMKYSTSKFTRKKLLDKEGRLSANLLANKFQGMFEQMKTESEELKDVTFKKHGPAVQMNVKRENGIEEFQVDLVPAYEIPENVSDGKGNYQSVKKYYVAKPFKEVRMPSTSSWRQSFSLDEKHIFQHIDDDEGNRKMCLRILKALCRRDAPLNKLNSYHLKTLLFHECRENPDKDWGQDYLGERFMDLLARLEIALAAKFLPSYFLSEINLFQDFKTKNCENMLGRIRRLRVSREAFFRCICTEKSKKKRKRPMALDNNVEEISNTFANLYSQGQNRRGRHLPDNNLDAWSML